MKKGSPRLLTALLILLFVFEPCSTVFAADQGAVSTDTAGAVKTDNGMTDDTAAPSVPSTTVDTTPLDASLAPSTSATVPEVTTSSSGSSPGDLPLDIQTASYQKQIHVNADSSGGLTYSYPISLPPGRNGMTPSIALTYNSQDFSNNSVLGYGWSTNIPFIERVNKTGVENMYSRHYYSSSVGGELATTSDPTVFYQRVDGGDFFKYVFATSTLGSTWTVLAKDGKTYVYGQTSSGRLDNVASSTQVFRWYLEQVTDLNKNSIQYQYVKDNGFVYPQTITYTNSSTTGSLVSGIYSVNFTLEANPYSITQYNTGFAVTNAKRVKEIDVQTNAVTRRMYVVNYTSDRYGIRNFISNIVETGIDSNGVSTTLPATSYAYNDDAVGFASDSAYAWAPSLTGNIYVPGDVTGDGLVDFSSAANNSGSIVSVIAINQGQGNSTVISSPSSIYPSSVPEPFSTYGNSYLSDYGSRMMDFNGDLLTDIARSSNAISGLGIAAVNTAYISNRLGWASTTPWSGSVPVNFERIDGNGYSVPSGVGTADVNGDGLTDFIYSDAGNYSSRFVSVNTGNGWASSSLFDPPVSLNVSGSSYADIYYDPAVRITDLNGDGLDDFSSSNIWTQGASSGTTTSLYLNNGLTGWVSTSSVALPEPFVLNDLYGNTGGIATQTQLGTRLVDVNGDGLPDVIRYDATHSINKVYINTGRGFVLSSSTVPANIDDVYDINGDGMVDFGSSLNTARKYGLLNTITYPTGGSTSVGYKSSADYQISSTGNQNPRLPLIVQTVNTIVINDGFGTIGTTTLNYENGEYYFNGPLDRKFSGFGKITKNNGLSVQSDYYHQGNEASSTLGEANDTYGKIGDIYKTEIFNTSGQLLSRVQNVYGQSAISGAYAPGGYSSSSPVFVFLSKKIDETYNPSTGAHRDHGVEYNYDTTNGNLISTIDRGEVTSDSTASVAAPTYTDSGTDLASTTISYAASTTVVTLPSGATTTTSIFAPSDIFTQNQSNATTSETRHYYDGQTLGTLLSGNETKTEQWKSGSGATAFASTTKVYDGLYGLVASSTDAIGNLTNYIYDTAHLYPATTTNAKFQSTGFSYDYSIGKVISSYDPNHFIHKSVYDGLGRPLATLEPDLSTGLPTATTTSYAYTDSNTPGSTSVLRTDYLSTATSTATYTYLDGLGRNLQTRKTAEGSNTFAVKDWSYNSVGQLASESLPYFASSSARTNATTTATLFTNYGYDALLRIATSTNAVGSTTNSYTIPWTVSTTDANSHVKDYVKDVYGNLSSVVEHNAGASYTTTYTYDLNKNLTNITDASGNVRNFTYDGLGRRLSAEDLHAPSDTYFGSYSYTYDDQGNVKTITDPNGTVFTSAYDVLNRPLTYSVSSSSVVTVPVGNKITYTYDTGGSCVNGAGHVCSIVYADETFATSTTATATTTYQYYGRGQVQTEIKTIRGQGIFTTGYNYDNLGNQIQVNQPDGNRIAYNYNSAGLVDSTVIGTSTLTTIGKSTHAPTGQITTIILGSGATTTNTYDAAHLYRLTNKKTTAILPSLATTTLQNLSYTYDSVGNIMQIADTSNTATAKTVAYTYDDLNRLLSASTTAATGGDYTQTYTYDPIGNITYKSDVGTYHYDGNSGVGNYANPHAVTSITTAQTAPTYVQSTSTDQTSSAKTTTLTFTASTTAHNLIIISAVWTPTTNVASVSDSQGNTFWTSINGFHNGATNTYQQLWYAPNIAGGADTITLTTVATTTERKLAIHEYSGLATSTAALVAWIGANHATSTTTATTASATSASNQLIFAFDNTGAGGVNAGTGYTKRENTLATEDSISIGSSSVTPSFTQTSGSWGAEGVILKAPIQTALATYTYDHNGNLTTVTGTSPATYTWDYNNRIASSTASSSTIQYTYDQSGQRVAQKNLSTLTTTLYPTATYDVDYNGSMGTTTQTNHFSTEGTLLATLTTPTLSNYNAGTCVFSPTASTTLTSNCTVSGTILLPYSLTVSSTTKVTLSATSTLLVDLKHNKVLVKQGSGILIKHGGTLRQVKASDIAPTLTYDFTDYLGSVTLTTDASNTVQETTDYYPYGSQRFDTKTGTRSESKKFIGQVFDSSTNLTYANARYLDNARGQFLSEDPVFWGKENLSHPQNLNSYSYAENSPIVNKDPSGRCIEDLCIGEGIFLGTLALEYAPQITAFTQSLLAPLGQIGINQAMSDSQKGSYLWASISLATSGEIPSSAAKYSVYVGRDAEEVIRYVGITSRDLAERFAEHLGATGTGRDLLKYEQYGKDTFNLFRNEARLVEQSVIDNNGLQRNGGQLLNRINSISPSNYINVARSVGQGSSSLQTTLSSLSSALTQLSSLLSKLK